MKILFINSVCGKGSTGRICTDLYDMATQKGHECYIAYGRDSAPKEYNSIKIGNKFDMYFHGFLSRVCDKHALGSRNATKKFLEKVKILDPDIIHLHNVHGYYINIKLLFDFLKDNPKIKVIWTLHDCWGFTGHCAYFTHSKCMKWKNDNCINCEHKYKYPSSYFLNNSYNNYKMKRILFNQVLNMVLVTPSEWLASLAKQSFLKEHQVMVIKNGIDIDKFRPKKIDIQSTYYSNYKKNVLGVASGFGERKGLDWFVKLREDLPSDIGIIMVGVDEEDKKMLSKDIVTIDKTNDVDELVELYSLANVFVNPTREDNYPTVNLEARACGTPVITTNVGGSPETIDSNTGIVVESYDQFLKCIIDVLDNRYNFSFSNVKQSADRNNCFNKYIELYEELESENTSNWS